MAIPNLAGKALLASAKCHTLCNGVKMPIMGLGTWRLLGTRLTNGVCGALQEGYGLIDTACIYGNEEEIREILKNVGEKRRHYLYANVYRPRPP